MIEPFSIRHENAGHERETELVPIQARTANSTDFATPVNLPKTVNHEKELVWSVSDARAPEVSARPLRARQGAYNLPSFD